MDRKAHILALIEQAFDGVSREGGVSLHEASAIDDGASSAERLVARAKDVDAGTCASTAQEYLDAYWSRYL